MSVILFSTILVSEARHIGSAAFHRRYAPRIEGQESTRGIAERRRTTPPVNPMRRPPSPWSRRSCESSSVVDATARHLDGACGIDLNGPLRALRTDPTDLPVAEVSAMALDFASRIATAMS